MSHRLMAVLEFDTGQLREFLQLPETTEIIDCQMDFPMRGRILLKIEGAGYPTTEGMPLHRQTCMITQRWLEDGTELKEEIRWPFVEYPDQKEN